MIDVLSPACGVYSDCGDNDLRLGSVSLFPDRLARIQSEENGASSEANRVRIYREKAAEGV